MGRELSCAPPGLAPTRVELGPGLAGRATERAGAQFGASCFVVVDSAVVRHHGEGSDTAAACRHLPGGDGIKNWDLLGELLTELDACHLDRSATLVAIGGGAVGDLGALAASLYLRGIDVVMVPTTLLSMVDSSVGGKTAVNLPTGKNLVGTFWAAREVWIDPTYLSSLPDEEFRSGLGEVVKIALGLDAELFDRLEHDRDAVLARDPGALLDVIEACLRAKIRIVEQDPREGDARRLLNLGHTLAHALEAHAGFQVPHGIAVARGLHAVVDIAERTEALTATDATRSRRLLESFGFTAEPLPSADVLLPHLVRDKKMASGTLHCVLPDGPGSSHTTAMEPRKFLELAGA